MYREGFLTDRKEREGKTDRKEREGKTDRKEREKIEKKKRV